MQSLAQGSHLRKSNLGLMNCAVELANEHAHPLICLVNSLIELVCLAFLVGIPDTRGRFDTLRCTGVDLSEHMYKALVQGLADDCSSNVL